MKSGSHLFPFAALSFPDSKKVLINCWVDRENCSFVGRLKHTEVATEKKNINRIIVLYHLSHMLKSSSIFHLPYSKKCLVQSGGIRHYI